MHTLIVEDDAELSAILQELLTIANVNAETIHDGALAVEYLAHTVPDLVILDLHLPNVSGLDILKQIKADARFSKTCVVVATADVRRARDLEKEVNLVLAKPFLCEPLISLVQSLESGSACAG